VIQDVPHHDLDIRRINHLRRGLELHTLEYCETRTLSPGRERKRGTPYCEVPLLVSHLPNKNVVGEDIIDNLSHPD
jgi:hypothetical protein